MTSILSSGGLAQLLEKHRRNGRSKAFSLAHVGPRQTVFLLPAVRPPSIDVDDGVFRIDLDSPRVVCHLQVDVPSTGPSNRIRRSTSRAQRSSFGRRWSALHCLIRSNNKDASRSASADGARLLSFFPFLSFLLVVGCVLGVCWLCVGRVLSVCWPSVGSVLFSNRVYVVNPLIEQSSDRSPGCRLEVSQAVAFEPHLCRPRNGLAEASPMVATMGQVPWVTCWPLPCRRGRLC
jgi:hypothetical protein